MSKDAVIFDLDGTLWDACEVMSRAWNLYMEENQPALAAMGVRSTEEIMRRSCGKTMRQLADVLMGQVEEESRYVISDACWDFVVSYIGQHGGQPYPKLRETFERLRAAGYHLYIVSNGQAGYIQGFMRLTGVEDLIEDTEDYGTTKKSKAENIRLVMERNALDRAVYVGDTLMDAQAAAGAKIPFIHARYGFGQVPEAAARADALEELPGIAAALFGRARQDGPDGERSA